MFFYNSPRDANIQFHQGSMVCPVAGCSMYCTHAHGAAQVVAAEYGPEIRIPMWCENGHEFDLWIRAYKGSTYLQGVHRPDREDDPTAFSETVGLLLMEAAAIVDTSESP